MNNDNNNIVREVNNNVDENKAREVNNEYKIKRLPFLVRFIIIIAILMGLFFACFYAIKLSKKAMEMSETTTTTTVTTTLSASEKFIQYLNKDVLRKFSNDTHTLILLPSSVANIYLNINVDEDGNLVNAKYGNYSLEDTLVADDTYTIGDSTLVGSDTLSKHDTEYKYYLNSAGTKILVMNATTKLLYAMYVNTTTGEIVVGKYVEGNDNITINGVEFLKNGANVTYDGDSLIWQK
jgi:hypothetical protein